MKVWDTTNHIGLHHEIKTLDRRAKRNFIKHIIVEPRRERPGGSGKEALREPPELELVRGRNTTANAFSVFVCGVLIVVLVILLIFLSPPVIAEFMPRLGDHF
jgi:hypothetical protein